MISAVVSARLAGLERIRSGVTSRFANLLPIFGASRLPRSFNDRALSGNAVSSQLDFAWRMRNSVFMQYPAGPGETRAYLHSARAHLSGACTKLAYGRSCFINVPTVNDEAGRTG